MERRFNISLIHYFFRCHGMDSGLSNISEAIEVDSQVSCHRFFLYSIFIHSVHENISSFSEYLTTRVAY